MADALTLSRGVSCNATIVFVDGVKRFGESMTGPVLASCDRVEIERQR
jgi:hypothetical protein